MNLNKTFLVGRLTQDPEVRTTPSGASVASFGLATNRVWNDQTGQKQEQVEFHSIVVWRKLAEIAGQYLKKGQMLLVEGRLQTRNWVGQDGIKRYRTEIVAENFQMGPKAGAYTAGGGTGASAPSPTANQPVSPISPARQPMAEQIPTIEIEEPTPASGESPNDNPGVNSNGDESEMVPF